MKKFFLFVLFFVLVIFPLISGKNSVLAENKLEINFFWGDGCPHCAKEKIFLDKLENKYPQIEIKRHEVYKNPENQKLLQEFAKKYNVQQLGVPLTFIQDRYFLGYRDDQTSGKEMENYLEEILEKGKETRGNEKVKLPIFGEISLNKLSLPVLAITLGAVDGFNPCAMWILLFLIALLIPTRSRKRLILIGGTFILASGIVYFLILSAWLNLFLAVSYVNLTRILIGVFALAAGVWQIKNFLFSNPAVCRVLGLEPKGIKGRMERGLKSHAEKIVASPITLAMIAGLIILALGVNLLEFFCSAGLPATFTRILALNQLSNPSYYLYLLFYTIIFMLDDLIIFSLAVITLNKIGFTEKYNYWATLIGGLLILILGLLLIFKPQFLMFG